MTLDVDGLDDFISSTNPNNNSTDKINKIQPHENTNINDNKVMTENEPITEDKNEKIIETSDSTQNKNNDEINVKISDELKAIFIKYDVKKDGSDNIPISHLFADPDDVENLINGTTFGNALNVLGATEDDYMDNSGKVDTDKYIADTENANNIILSYPEAFAAYYNTKESNNFLLKPIYTVASKWQRGIQTSNGALKTITSARPQDKLKTQSDIPDNIAIEIIRSITGAGRKTIVPLVHSGVIVTMKPPTLSEYTRIKEALAVSRGELGRETNGLLFNATSVYIDRDILNLVFSLITSSNVVTTTQEYLMSVIRQLDIPTLMLGAIAARYPDGYEFHWSCIQDLDKCNYVVKTLADVKQFFRVDNSKLTDYQKTILTSPNVVRGEDDLMKYQSDFNLYSNNTPLITEMDVDGVKVGILLKLRIPTLSEYIGEGSKWIKDIQESIRKASTATVGSQKEREYIIAEKIHSILLEGFLPWVEKIILRNTTTNRDYEIGDMDKIAEMLREHSTNPMIHTKIRDAILQFINDNTKAIIGIPNFECPNCGGWQTTNNDKVDIIIPIDLYTTFFTTLQSMERRLLEK